MCQKFTPEQLKNMDMETKDGVIFQMQDRLDKLEHDYENLIWMRSQDSSPFLMKRKRTAWKTQQNQQ